MLPGCLASVRELTHDIVVVDTGSRDRTVEIARKAGARVETMAWSDDFAAARNASLAPARGDFILVLDADERLAKGAAALLKRAVERADFDCGMLPMHEAARLDAPLAEVVSGKARRGEPNYLPRLLRRAGDLRFEGIIHESILSWLTERGMRVAFIDAPLVHLGAVRAIREERGKVARNIALLEKAALARPDDLSPFGYLAHEHLESGQMAEARHAVSRGWALVEKASRGGLSSVLRLATARARIALEAGEFPLVLDTVSRAEALEGPHPDLDFLRGSAHEMEAAGARREGARTRHLESAQAAYAAAMDKRGHRYAQAFVVGATSWAGATRVGTVLLAQGRLTEAMAAFEQALSFDPSHLEAKLGVVECLLDSGSPERVLSIIPALVGERPDGWLLGAAALDMLGLVDDFRLFLARARERAPRGYLAPHRRERHAALHGALSAYLGTPTSVPGRAGAVFSLLAREPLPHPDGAPFPLDVARVERLIANLIAQGQFALIPPLLEPRAEQVIPGLGATVTGALTKLGLDLLDDGEPSYAFLGALGDKELGIARGLLSSHPELSIIDASGPEGLGARVDQGADDAALRAYLTARAPGRPRAIFMIDHAILHLDRLARMVPAARFILLARDVRALVGAAGPDLLGEPGDAAARAGRWAEMVRLIHAEAAPLGGRYLEMRYEDLLADPPASVRRLLAFLGEPEDPRVLRHLVDAYPGRPDRWRRELGAETRQRVESVAREGLTTLGYEVVS